MLYGACGVRNAIKRIARLARCRTRSPGAGGTSASLSFDWLVTFWAAMAELRTGYRSVERTVGVAVGHIELNRLVGTRNERDRSVMSSNRLRRAVCWAGHRDVHSDDIADIGDRIK